MDEFRAAFLRLIRAGGQASARGRRLLRGPWARRLSRALGPGGGLRGSARAGLARLASVFGLQGWRRGAAVAATGGGVLLLLALAGGGAPRLEPGAALPEIIGFYQNGWSQIFRSSFPSVEQHYNKIDTVLAFWYSVDGDGRLQSNQPSPAVTAWIKQHHMRMGVLINNVAGPSGDNGGMLTHAAARTRAVQAIARVSRAQGYQEVNIDFELLAPDTRSGLVDFMKQLRAALPSGVTLSESVFPKLGVPASINAAYDYAALAKYADYLVIMLYDNHSDGGPSGPVSPYGWVADNLNWFLHTAKIPANRLVLAAGVYGYDWVQGTTQAAEMPLTQVTALLKGTGATSHLDPVSENPYFNYTSAGGTAHVVWYQDPQTVRQRLNLAHKLGIRGLAIWALGEETPAVWGAIEQTWGTK